VVQVNEEGIAGAILNLLDKANIVAEGAGAVPVAALMEGRILKRAKRFVLVISGGISNSSRSTDSSPSKWKVDRSKLIFWMLQGPLEA
jgi:threonine dehydratase